MARIQKTQEIVLWKRWSNEMIDRKIPWERNWELNLDHMLKTLAHTKERLNIASSYFEEVEMNEYDFDLVTKASIHLDSARRKIDDLVNNLTMED
jgi:hypothetical protein